jgi:hypothetical protein
MESFTAGSAESSRDENEDPYSLLEGEIAGESLLRHLVVVLDERKRDLFQYNKHKL